MGARRFISWPREIRATNRLPRGQVYFTDSNESEGGINDDTSLRAGGKRVFDTVHDIPYDYPWLRRSWEWMQGNIQGLAGRIWYPEVCSYYREHVRCGPTADGVNATFPVPVFDATTGPFIYSKESTETVGKLQTDALISPIQSNFLSDDQAAIISGLSGINSFGLGTISETYEYRYYYGQSLRSAPVGSASNFGWETDPVTVRPSRPLTGVFWAISADSLVIRAQIELFDSLMVSLGTFDSVATPMISGTWVPVSVSITTPANAEYAVLRGYSLVTTTQSWWSDCRGLMLFEQPWWWLPSEAPLSALLASPPPEYSVVTASGVGVWSYLCRPSRDRIGDEIGPQGHVMASLDLQEVWERYGVGW